MKKLVLLFMVFPVFLAGCTAKTENQTVGSFSLDASVVWNDFSYECSVVYNANDITVTARSTSADGLVLSYNGKTVSLAYEDINLTQSNKNFDPSNPAVALFDVFQFVNNSQDAQPQTIKDGYLINGETSLGAFTLETDEKFLPVSLSFTDAGLTFSFYQE